MTKKTDARPYQGQLVLTWLKSILPFHVNLSLFCTSKSSKVLINEKAKVFRDVAEGTTCHILYRLHVKLENFADFLFQLFTQLASLPRINH